MEGLGMGIIILLLICLLVGFGFVYGICYIIWKSLKALMDFIF